MDDIKDRIKEAMCSQGITAIELSRRTGIPKSSISQYLSGFTKPRANRICSIAKALNVSEVWLMGYDVEKERKANHDCDESGGNIGFLIKVSLKQKEMLEAYNCAPEPTKKAIDMLLGLNEDEDTEQTKMVSR